MAFGGCEKHAENAAQLVQGFLRRAPVSQAKGGGSSEEGSRIAGLLMRGLGVACIRVGDVGKH